ncbi:MAG: tetratricopeptide repeat protein [Anaerolineae bacterium]|nr:tetratricopeptide repeat protein [Anaerolineae bacterium]
MQSNLNNGGQYVEETFYWQGMVYAAQGQTADARNAFRQVLSINPNAAFAQEALNRLG